MFLFLAKTFTWHIFSFAEARSVKKSGDTSLPRHLQTFGHYLAVGGFDSDKIHARMELIHVDRGMSSVGPVQ